MFSYKLIELPFWKGQWSHAKPAHVILVSLLLMSTTILTLNQQLLLPPQTHQQTADVSLQWRMDLPIIYKMKCDAWYAHDLVQPCIFGTETAKKTVVLLGDSIGAQWFSLIQSIYPQPDWRTIVLTKSACAMVDENKFYAKIGKDYTVCTSWRNKVLDFMDELKPEIIFVGSASTNPFNETQWVEGSSRIFDRLRKAAKNVFVIPGTPTLGLDGPGCVSRHLSQEGLIDDNACQAKNRLKNIEYVTHLLNRATQRFDNVYLLDLNHLVCPGKHCKAVSQNGMVVYRDGQHLTNSFVESLVPEARQLIRSSINPSFN